jgi:hypothetical protein
MGRVDVRMGRIDVRMGRVDVRMGRVDVRAGRVDVRMGRVDVRAGRADRGRLLRVARFPPRARSRRAGVSQRARPTGAASLSAFFAVGGRGLFPLDEPSPEG